MTNAPLPNYLRAHRKRHGLTQKEFSYLLGRNHLSTLARYEGFIRIPHLETAFACAIVLATPTRELFASLYRGAELRVAERAAALLAQLAASSANALNRRKRERLRALSALACAQARSQTSSRPDARFCS